MAVLTKGDGIWKSAAGLKRDCNVKKRSAGGWPEHLQQEQINNRAVATRSERNTARN